MIRPPKLNKGDIVALTAPSGPCEPSKVDQAVQAVKNLGLSPLVMASCNSRHGYFAGSDAQRARDIMNAFMDPQVKGIFSLRGGYGAQRLLPLLDYKLIAKNPKIFTGYSDITALHLVLNQFCRLITYHAPMAATELPEIDEWSLNSFLGNVMEGYLPPKITMTRVISSGSFGNNSDNSPDNNSDNNSDKNSNNNCQCTGILIGGNLSLLVSSLGTPYELDTRGKILFMEEIQEEPYKVDRMFLQLKQSGKLKDCQAILLGSFMPETSKTLSQAIDEILVPLGKPLGVNLPCGHCLPTATLPLGSVVQFDGTYLTT